MFRKQNALDMVIERLTRELAENRYDSAETTRRVDELILLNKVRNELYPPSVDKNTLVIVGGNLLGILMIIKHENVNVITSKALNLIVKPRI